MSMELDEIDKAFVDSFVPDGSIPTALISIVAWMDADGSQRWRMYVQSDATTATCLGYLDMAKHRMLVDQDDAQDWGDEDG